MVYALQNKIVVDVFVVYTDCETYYGMLHPKQVLAQYRKRVNRDAKLVVVGMTATKFMIPDPEDAGALEVMGEFVGGIM
ncbi:hypothetical protein M427DRAFT_58103 [Gonapodya prolifera JEL478]|uniref:RNA-binding protein RO60 vWA domain-containing protein n=1 Tax=Gonapodya prolifera (strain JEL478) TaxID=1344416 RepID=A0A139AAM1_GONPJ|nr:hypothetical protein M427DRAFT_58103 [Gonapodya prolifera JEL478]|eukprot:KXS13846.1 hypothetical protein M427DRAFT_58103 [Gonapodya prolifera JEL478]